MENTMHIVEEKVKGAKTFGGKLDKSDAGGDSAPSLVNTDGVYAKDPLQNLTSSDQKKFMDFGWGPEVSPDFPTIIAGMNHQTEQQPEQVAVTCGDKSITYGELDLAANRLANILMSHGVTRGDAVCLYLHRSIEMVVGIVAILRVGAAYVPQHVGVAPMTTLTHVAAAVKSKVTLTLSQLSEQIPASDGCPNIFIDHVMQSDSVHPRPDAAQYEAQPNDRTMILFTSGTTGVPNGVQVTHKNLANVLLTAPGNLGMKPGVTVGQVLSIAFDMGAWETLGALSNGATLLIRGRSIQETAEKVDILIGTPSILNSLDATRCHNVKTAAVAGEPCPRPLADEWSKFCRFYNSCGPTETTIINTAEPHQPDKDVLSIGRPTPNNTVYILDDNLNPLPIGEKGEMWAGGDCVTLGYLNNPGLTQDRYRSDPFRPGEKMFRTKDLGRWTETGELEHFGRVDDLVKIRGFRVELDGISAALEENVCCEQAVTLKYDDRNLISFVSPSSASLPCAKKVIGAKLPYYCMPSLFIPVEELPRTVRGKIDKRKLIDLAKAEIEKQGVDLN